MSLEQAHTAISRGDITSLRQMNLLSFVQDSSNGWTLLNSSCQKGNVEIVKLLLSVDGIDVNKGKPLYTACDIGHLEIVKLLLNVEGINVNKGTGTPLYTACKNGHFEIVKLLLAVNEINVNEGYVSIYTNLTNPSNQITPLYISCVKGHVEIVKLLLLKNAEIDNRARKAFDEIIKVKMGVDILLDELKDQLENGTMIVSEVPYCETLKLNSDQERIKELELMVDDLKQQVKQKEEVIKTMRKKNSKLNYLKQIQAMKDELPSMEEMFNTQKDIQMIKKELNRLNNQITEAVYNNPNIGLIELKQIINERNNLRNEIKIRYSEKLAQFETEKKDLSNDMDRLETSIREYRYLLETLQNIDQLSFEKEELLQSIVTIKDEIEDVEIEKDEVSVKIRQLKKTKGGTPQEIESLEKKQISLSQKLSELNGKQSEVQQKISFFIPNFPEVILEIEQRLSGREITSTQATSFEERFRIFAIQNSILLNTSLTDYRNRVVVHTGLSVVYKATKHNNQVVILKEISLTESSCDTVMNEIMNILRLKGHSRIIKLNGVFMEPHKVFIETPYYTNGNLLEYITKIRAQNDLSALKTKLRVLFRKIVETMQFIHSKDILHRDLKPQNILVNENGEPIIADFGSSKKLIAQLTNNTMGVGTSKYMALEVKRQEEAPNEKSDIWSLGVSLFECWKVIHNQQSINDAVEVLDFDINGKVILPTSSLSLEIDILMMKMLSHMFEPLSRNRPSALMILTDEEYFTHENPVSVDILSRSNQEMDSIQIITLWQARLKKLKELALRSSFLQHEIRFEIHRTNLMEDISSSIVNLMTRNNKMSIFFKTYVKFIDERGIDLGGLSNELFSKFIENVLLESKHFQNSETSSIENFVLTNEPLTKDSTKLLKTFGWLLKKLLIDCDDKTVFLPLNSFIFYYLLNGDISKKMESLSINEIILTLSRFLREYDFELENQIMNLAKCKNDAELQSVTFEESFFDVLSQSEKPLIMENVQLFIVSQLYSYFYTNEKITKLQLIKEGFDWFNLKQFKSQLTYSSELNEFLRLQGSDFDEQYLKVNELKILLSGQSYIDADLLLNEMNFSAISSSLQDIFTECIRKLNTGQLRQLLCWMTALSSIPMRGFSRKIRVSAGIRFAAHTCSFSFDIPSQFSDINTFEPLFLNCLRLSSDSTMEEGL